MKNNYHVHFGAGLGLVSLLRNHFTQETPIAILQSPHCLDHSDDCSLLQNQLISYKIDKEKNTMDFICITRNTNLVKVEELLADGTFLYVTSSDINIQNAILTRSTSFSTAIGPSRLDYVIRCLTKALQSQTNSTLPNGQHALRRVYLFESYAKLFKKRLEDQLGTEHFEVIQLMCDCSI